MEDKKKEDIALFRYNVIFPLISPDSITWSNKSKILSKLSSKVYKIPYSSKTTITESTIRRWIYKYKKGGFGGLKPKYRKDTKIMRTISPQIWKIMVSLRKGNPNISIKEIIQTVEEKGNINSDNLKLSTLYRYFKLNKLDRKSLIKQKIDYKIPEEKQSFKWMLGVLQGKIEHDKLLSDLKGKLVENDIVTLKDCILNKPLRYRNRALTILAYYKPIPQKSIIDFIMKDRDTIKRYIKKFEKGGVQDLLDFTKNIVKKYDDPKYKESLFSILHAPPSSYGFNRTTWKIADIKNVMLLKGLKINSNAISKIFKDAGFRFLKAKKVLTSTDPDYHEKLQKITDILSNLNSKEKFFSIDEFGPFSIKMIGGRSLVAPGEHKIVPQRQISKGRLIITAALELSTNQITHFYSDKKNTNEMIKLLEILLESYSNEDIIYFSWDAASWHASKKFYRKVEEVNNSDYIKEHKTPIVKLAPLPSGSQFLNVIESVFSGMARAIIHNSNYQSVEECKSAIDRYFLQRNKSFKQNPKKAGKKIWGCERTNAIFSISNNCKDPHYSNF